MVMAKEEVRQQQEYNEEDELSIIVIALELIL